MKKVISIFICIISLFSFVMSYNAFDIEKSNEIVNIENEIGESFYIPEDTILSDPTEIYSVLEKVSKELKVNIFRQSIVSDKNGNLEARKYALISSSTDFFEYFTVKGMDNIEENLKVNKFISTKKTTDKNQIGFIEEFGNNDNIYIGNLKNLYDISMVQGTYFVELPNNITYDIFIKKLTDEINYKFNENFSYKYFESYSNEYVQLRTINKEVILYSGVILIITVILMSYIVIKNSKKINIYKLQGISNIRIWLNIFQISNTIIFSMITFILVLLSFILKLDIEFIKYIVKYQVVYYCIVTIITLIPYILIIKTSINLGIKNKTNENLSIIFNNLFKVILTYIIILSSITLIDNYKVMNQELDTFGDWEKSKRYGVFYPKYSGEDTSKKDYINSNVTMSNELYRILNKQGSVFIHSLEYQDDLEVDSSIEFIKSIKVNPNYLKEFPIYDLSGNTIAISEKEEDRILLVPEDYKKEEQSIIAYFKENKNALFDFEKIEFSGKVRKQVESQDIRIIWMKNNQNIFSFNPEVNKKNNNLIKDPIIEVVTENNSVHAELFGILGGGSTDPLKIKLVNNDPKATYESLKPFLIELHLEDNLKYIVVSNESELWNIYNMEEKISILYLSLAISVSCFLAVMLQNIVIVFAKYKKKIIVRRLFGLSYIKSYKEHILLFTMNWTIQLLLLAKYISRELFLVIIVYSSIEAICSIGSIIRIEQKNKISTIKGE